MDTCRGDMHLATRVDQDMLEYVEAETERLGVNRATFLRRLLLLYRRSRREEMDCPHCAEPIMVDLS